MARYFTNKVPDYKSRPCHSKRTYVLIRHTSQHMMGLVSAIYTAAHMVAADTLDRFVGDSLSATLAASFACLAVVVALCQMEKPHSS